jgi:uncharacterized RDD family membrane protein YckC
MAFCTQCGSELNGSFCSNCGASAERQALAPATSSPTGSVPPAPSSLPSPQPPFPYASWGRRVLGSLLDFLFFGIPSLVLSVVGLLYLLQGLSWSCEKPVNGYASSTECTLNGGSYVSGVAVACFAVVIVIGILYGIYVVFAIGGKHGATAGMRVLKIKCVREANFGVVGYGLSLGRFVVTAVFGVITIVNLLQYLWPLWDGKRQTLHDKAVGTVVLDLRGASPAG